MLSLGIVLLGILQAPLPSISGRVRNVGVVPAPVLLGGQPFSNMRVAIGTIGYTNGRRTFASRLTAQADAAGNYRLSNVNPGEYYLRADSSQLMGLAAYHPGTRDVDGAIKVAVQPGEEIVGMDFDSNHGPMFKISGTVQKSFRCCGGKWHSHDYRLHLCFDRPPIGGPVSEPPDSEHGFETEW